MKGTEDLITAYLSGNASAGECAQLEAWLLLDGNKKIFVQYRETWEATGSAKQVILPETDLAWEKFSACIPEPQKTNRYFTKKTIYWLAAAAVIIPLLFFVMMPRSGPSKNTAYKPPVVLQNNPLKTLITADSIMELTLPDSSKILLNKNSRISFPVVFLASERIVKLEGEAFFEVRHDPRRPFVIYANGSVTKVLGTSFNIRAYKENDLELTVVTGTVQFAVSEDPGKEKITLNKNDQVKLNQKTGQAVKTTNTNSDTGWWRGRKQNRFKKFLGKMKKIFKKENK